MNRSYSLEELAATVRDWCEGHRLQPASGQAAEQVTERTIRYYRTLGLLDAPEGGYLKRFTEKHRLQLLAIRLYQALGLPLRRIREELYGQSESDLREMVRQGARCPLPSPGAWALAPVPEHWAVTALTEEFLLVSRQGQSLSAGVLERLREVLRHANKPNRVDATQNQEDACLPS